MRIVVDAMGTDSHPGPDVAGAVMAAREWGVDIILVGDQARIGAELSKQPTSGLKIEVAHAPEVIEMTDKPADSAKHKSQSSMHVGTQLVADGEAQAFVSAGNTGGILAVSTLYTLKRIKGVSRPALSAVFPNLTANKTVVSDIGANTDCRPEYLLQFGVMAGLYAELALQISKPRVALLSNGEEEEKGNTLVKETADMMRASKALNYVGNVEPKEVLRGVADVVIADGFTGNIMLKTLEATASMVGQIIREEIGASLVTKLGGAIAYPAFGRVRKRTDPFEIGGAPLLGVNGVVIVAHGRSNAFAIKNAVNRAREAVSSNLVEAIRAGVAGLPEGQRGGVRLPMARESG
jgi:glycerol-3-phosphate acyltransferase PlsX